MVSKITAAIRRKTRDIVTSLVETTYPAVRTEICSALCRFIRSTKQNDIPALAVDEVWQPVIDAIETLLEDPAGALYGDIFSRMLRQFCLGFYCHFEHVLEGDITVKGWRSPGASVDMLEEGIQLTKSYFCAGGVSETYLHRMTGKKSNLTRFLILHMTDTDALVDMYTAITSAAPSAAQATLGDQVAEIRTVLGTRTRTDEAAQVFITEIGVAAHGSVPKSLGLPDEERLDAKAGCKHNLFGALYATTGYVSGHFCALFSINC